MSFDAKCHQLADAFLDDYELADRAFNVNELAQVIQNAIEEYIAEHGLLEKTA